MRLLLAVGALLYLTFGVGCVLASWHWSVAWTVVGLLLFLGWRVARRSPP